MPEAKSIFEANILVVDDEPGNCALLETVLGGAGYSRVTSCSESAQVQELHREHHYDLILLDLEMPGMGGFEVMEGIRELGEESYLPVIVITGSSDSKLASLKAGARDFVNKPFDIEEVLLRIHNTLEMRMAHQQALTTSQRMENLALHDSLTGLANRRLLEDRVRMAVRQAHRARREDEGSQAAVLFLDLDGFKNVNDTLGHHAGDALLKQVAGRLQAAVRGDDTVARLGGDEFVVTLTKVAGVEDASRVAQKIIEAIARPYDLDGPSAQVTTSVGIAIYPAHGKDAETLMKSADTALYRAKDAGKNVYRVAETGGGEPEPRQPTERHTDAANENGEATGGATKPAEPGHHKPRARAANDGV
ncbi:MAG: Diguanylate cyclase response regulator [Betaproteobacteria bacterium]|nr:Diguanylate cyclase response regulator [Betaproteobacteria bacterium]